jgi:hypothetical protein
VSDTDERKTALLLAAIDMAQTIQAAMMLAEVSAAESFAEKHQRLRALETAVAITYARPLTYTKGSYVVEQHERTPTGSAELLRMHDHLIEVRHKTYAHTDRSASLRTAGMNDDGFIETWVPWIQADDVPVIIELAEHQQRRFRRLALFTYLSPPR